MKNHPKTRPFNRLRFILDRSLTVNNLLDTVVADHDGSAIFHSDQPFPYPGLGTSITPKQLLMFTNKVGNVLRDRCGVQRYDRVAIYKQNSGDYFFLGLAVMRAGGIAVPVNGGLPTTSLIAYLKHTGTRTLLTDLATYNRLQASGMPSEIVETIVVAEEVNIQKKGVLSLGNELQSASEMMEAVQLSSDDNVLIVHTSGTTGFPKGVIHTSGTLVAGIKGQLKVQPIFRNHTGLSAAPFNHFINYLGLLSALAAQVETWLVSDPKPQAILDLIDRERINVVFCFPHTYGEMYKTGLDNHDLDSVRLWLAGADSSHEAHIQPFTKHGALLRVFGFPLIRSMYVDTWGSSEVGFAALFRFAFSFSHNFGRYVGKPTFAGPKVMIADDMGKRLPAGQVGRMMVKGPTLFKGYWNAHDLLHGVMCDGWWWTGDLGFCDRRGRYFHYDRAIDVIQSHNGPVYTLPIEELILKEPGIAEAVVIGRTTIRGDQEPVALVQAMPDFNLDLDTLKESVNSRLPKNSPLVDIVQVDEGKIPRGLTGKVLKREVRANYDKALLGMKQNIAVMSGGRVAEVSHC